MRTVLVNGAQKHGIGRLVGDHRRIIE